MCGIVGTLRFDQREVDASTLAQQVRSLHHRGPDGNGMWIKDFAGLGHTRLAILDLSANGAQPMVSADHRYVLVYNGEIYNFQDLRKSLQGRHTFRSTSDTEVLLYGLIHYGSAWLEKLEGMFAFAFYDAHSRKLLLARDPFGMKPLYYHVNKNRIAFASEIKPLFFDSETPREPNHAALRQHLLFGYAVDPATAFKDIYRLEPGTFLEIDADGSMRRAEYWHVEELLSLECGEIPNSLRESVRLHCVSDVPNGLFLSGGIDSSLLLACCDKEGCLDQGFRAYNVGLDPNDKLTDAGQKLERSIAAKTCEHYGVDLVKIHPMESSAPSIRELISTVEEPINNPSNSLIDLVCVSARARGTIVLLSGHGGDELFAGYRRHVWARYLSWFRIPGAAQLGRLIAYSSRNTLVQRMAASIGNRGVHPLISIAAVGWDLIAKYNIAPEWFGREAMDEAAAPLAVMLDRWSNLSMLKQMMLLDIKTYLAAQNLINMDKCSMHRSVEVRLPFLWRRLAARGLQTPDRLLISRFQNKACLRAVASGMLPEFITKAPKMGFGPPEDLVVRSPEGQELLLGSRSGKRGLVSGRAIATLVSRVCPGAAHLAVQLYGLMAIEQWFRCFIDENPTSEPPQGQLVRSEQKWNDLGAHQAGR